jgi:integrase
VTCIHAQIRASDGTVQANPPTPTKSRAKRRSRYEGIVARHARPCTSRCGGRCSCDPAYQAQVWSARDGKTIRKTFPSLGEARAWRHESHVALRKGTLRAPSSTTLSEVAEQWLTAAEAGLLRTRSGDAYKPSAVRAYRQALRHRVLPTLGTRRFTTISQAMLQDLADQLAAQGLSASSIRNTILPLRAIYRRALNRGEVALDPTCNLTLPEAPWVS